MDYVAWRFWTDIGQTFATVAIGIYVWWDKRGIKTTQRFEALETWKTEKTPVIEDLIEEKETRGAACARHQDRTSKLEIDQRSLQIDISHLPNRQDQAELSKQIVGLTEKLATLDGRLIGINRAVDLLNQHHLRISE